MQGHAASTRDAGIRRLNRLTALAVSLAAAAGGVFAGIAASSTHPRRAVGRTAQGVSPQQASSATAVPGPAATVAVNGGASSPASASAPSVSGAAPVVVSGGS